MVPTSLPTRSVSLRTHVVPTPAIWVVVRLERSQCVDRIGLGSYVALVNLDTTTGRANANCVQNGDGISSP